MFVNFICKYVWLSTNLRDQFSNSNTTNTNSQSKGRETYSEIIETLFFSLEGNPVVLEQILVILAYARGRGRKYAKYYNYNMDLPENC